MKLSKSHDFYAGAILITLFLAFFIIGIINFVSSQPIQFDGAWNASIATNLIRHGEYRVSYPQPLPFYFKISTGLPVLLPASWLMNWLGVSNVSINLIAIIYASLAIILFWILLSLCLPKDFKFRWILSSIIVILLILSDPAYNIISGNLFGEPACIFFLLMAMIAWLKYYDSRKNILLFFSGAMLALMFLTKVATIFILVSCFGILLIETLLTKRMSWKSFYLGIGGFISGFALTDGLKLYSLGSFREYLQWWITEWRDMIHQSGGDGNPSILQKYDYLERIFGSNPFFGLLFIVIAILIYLYGLRFLRKQYSSKHGHIIMGYCGLSGASILVYYLLFGSQGLMKYRRLAVNEIFVRLCIIFLLGCLIICFIDLCRRWSRNDGNTPKNKVFLTLFSILLLIWGVFPPSQISKNLSTLLGSGEPTYYLRTMHRFLDEVDHLPQDATIYTAGWWQEPNVTIFLDREMTDVTKSECRKEPSENDFFIIGLAYNAYRKADIENYLNAELTRYDEINVNYDSIYIIGNKEDLDLFAIYKVNYRE